MRSLMRAAGVIGLCLVLALSGCSLRNPRTGAPAVNPLNNTPANSWVSTSPGTAVLVQFTRAGQTLQGTLDVTIFNANLTDIVSQHSGFTGTIEGNNITLNFPQGFGFAATVSGSIDSARLALNFPDATTGSLVTVTLTPGGLDKYQAGVAAMKATAAANAEGQAQAAATAAARGKLNDARDAVAVDISKLHSLLGGVSFSKLDGDIATAQKDLATTQTDAQKAINEGPGSVNGCYDAGTATYDAGTVAYDQGTVSYDESTVASTIDSVNQLVAKLQQDYGNLQVASAGVNDSVDPATANDVDTLKSSAKAATSTWTAKLASYTSQAQQLVDKANAAANAATKAACP